MESRRATMCTRERVEVTRRLVAVAGEAPEEEDAAAPAEGLPFGEAV